MRVLRLTGTAITEAGLAHLANLGSLVALDLEVCEEIADEGCQTLGEMKQLKALVLKKTGFQPKKISSAGVANLGTLRNLEVLNLYGNPIKDESLTALAELSELRELDLSLTAITDAGLTHLAPLKKLQRLELLYSEGFAGPKITGQGLEHVAVHRQLLTLNIVGAKISDDSLKHLETLARLESLQLANTRVSDEAIEKLQTKLAKCKIVR